MLKVKISNQIVMDLICAWIILFIFNGCGFPKRGGGNNNTITAGYIYGDVKSEDDRTTMLRREVFKRLQKIINKKVPGQIPVNSVFDSISGLDMTQVEFVKKAVRRYVKPPKLATDPKVVVVKDFRSILLRILHLYEYDSLINIVPTWRK
ncbi:MAG: hypothetical protein V3U02_08130 [Calditrichia bacterium]